MFVSETIRVFISTTTSDLGECREAVASVLRKGQIFPIIQEELQASADSLHDTLIESISSCQAVICIVGTVFGAAPKFQSGRPRSYTQMEYDAARQLGKPTFIFLTHETFSAPAVIDEAGELHSMQQLHRAQLLENHKCEWFYSTADLRLQIAHLIPCLLDSVIQPIYYLHPPQKPAFFVGRKLEFEQLECGLRQPAPSVLAVVGMGGQGKTTLVSEFFRLRPTVRFAAGFWCTAYRAAFTFDMFLDEILSYLLHDKFSKQSSQSIESRIRALMGCIQNRRTLIVIDGIERWLHGWRQDDPARADRGAIDARAGAQEGLDDFLAQATGLSNGSHLILTTRTIPSALDMAALCLVPIYGDEPDPHLRGIELEPAIELLRRYRVRGTDEQLSAAAAAWDCHPLALSVLAGLLYKRFGGDIARLPSLGVFDKSLPINALLDETRRHLPHSRFSDHILMATALAEEAASVELVAEGVRNIDVTWKVDLDELIDQIVILSDWQILDWNSENGTVSAHPLVEKYFEDQIDEDLKKRIHRAYAHYYSQQEISIPLAALADVRVRILAIIHSCHSEEIAQGIGLFYGEIRAGISFQNWLAGAGHHVTAIDLASRLVKLAEGVEKGKLLSQMGRLKLDLNALDDALADLNCAVNTLQPISDGGEAGIELAGALINRGNAHRERYSGLALDDFDAALDVLARISGLQWKIGAAWLNVQLRLNKSNYLSDRGRLRDAYEQIENAIAQLRGMERMNPAGVGPTLAMAEVNRAMLLMDFGAMSEADSCWTEADTILSRVQAEGRGDLDSQMAWSLAVGAVIKDVNDDPEGALNLFNQAIDLFQTQAEQGRRDIELDLARTLMNRCFCQTARRDLYAAVQDGERALAMLYRRCQTDGRARGYLAHTRLNLAETYFLLGRMEESSNCMAEGFDAMRQLARDGVSNAAVILRKTFHLAALYAGSDAQCAARLLREGVVTADAALSRPEEIESTAVEVVKSWKRYERKFPAGTVNADLVTSLQGVSRLVERCRSTVESMGDQYLLWATTGVGD